MCYNPIIIPNKRNELDLHSHPLFQTVPCGHCQACILSKRNDWFVRLYYEWQKYKSTGMVVFPTLTFNDDRIPIFDIKDDAFKVLDQFEKRPVLPKMACFDKKQIQNFLKKLRTRLSRKFGIDHVKYFIVCEYGSDERYTKRSHYHIILFLPIKVSDIWLKNLIEFCWSSKVSSNDKLWSNKKFQRFTTVAQRYFYDNPSQDMFVPTSTKRDEFYKYCAHKNMYGTINYFVKNGNVSWSKDFGAEIQTSEGLKYVTKYLDKGNNAFYEGVGSKVRDYLKKLPLLKSIEDDEVLHAVQSVKNVLPFNLSSNNIGSDLFDDLDIRSQLAEQHTKCVDAQLVPNQVLVEGKYYAIPYYITRRLFYDTQEVNRYDYCFVGRREFVDVRTCRKSFVNELGLEVMKKRFDLRVDELVRDIRIFMSNGALEFFRSCFIRYDNIEQSFVDRWLKVLKVFTSLPVYNPYHLAYYILVYRNVLCPSDFEFSDDPLDTRHIEFHARWLFSKRLHTLNDFDEIYHSRDAFMLNSLLSRSYSDTILLENYDLVFDCFNNIKQMFTLLKFEAGKRNDSERYAQLLNNFINSNTYV